ncbi:MAG: hypothetical protein AB1405_08990 [Bdellovibrionota bacterium]
MVLESFPSTSPFQPHVATGLVALQPPDAETALMPSQWQELAAPQREKHLALIRKHPGSPRRSFVRCPVSHSLEPFGAGWALTTFSADIPTAALDTVAAIALHGGSIRSGNFYPRSDGSLLFDAQFHGPTRKELEGIGETLLARFGGTPAGKRTPFLEEVRDLKIAGYTPEGSPYTALEVRAADTRGLLYRILRAFVVLGIRVTRAEVNSAAGLAHDVFLLTDRKKMPLNAEREIPYIQREILAAK